MRADMAELADALDLGSSGRPCRFDSCYPHKEAISTGNTVFVAFFFFGIDGQEMYVNRTSTEMNDLY